MLLDRIGFTFLWNDPSFREPVCKSGEGLFLSTPLETFIDWSQYVFDYTLQQSAPVMIVAVSGVLIRKERMINPAARQVIP